MIEIIKHARETVAADFYRETRLFRAKLKTLRDIAEERGGNAINKLRRWQANPHIAPIPKASWDRVPLRLTRLQPSSFMWPEAAPARAALDQLIHEARDFMASQRWYTERGIPYR